MPDWQTVLFPKQQWAGLEDGSITVAFRRWRRPTVRAGGRLRSPAGVLAIDEVTPIDERDITEGDAHRAGHPDVESALAALRVDGTLYRIRFHRTGDDDRIALRGDADLRGEAGDRLMGSLRRLPWAPTVLALIDERSGVVSTELAALTGQEQLPFKQRVRRLKELGLTESLPVGYRLTPRGRAALERLRVDSAPPSGAAARPVDGSARGEGPGRGR